MRRPDAIPSLALVVVLGVASLPLAIAPARGADWPRFRGASGSGVSEESGLPERWGESEGLLWKTPLPGPGSSSPIVLGTRVFLTCYSGYGASQTQPGEQEKLRRHVVCVDADSGKVLWDRSIESRLPEEAFRGIGIPNHGYASSTPVADGERVYAFFGKTGVIAYDLEGKEAWRAAVAPDPRTHGFGTASSPVLWKDLLIVPASIECESVIAYDRRTGKEAWRSPAEGYGGWFGTPVAVESGGRTELIFNVPGEVWGMNPENGKLRWHAESFPERTLCTSAVVGEGVVYVIGGREGGAIAVRTGGKGDVTQSQVVWKGRLGSYVPSPVLHGGHLYWVTDRGLAYCVRADTGDKVNEKRLEGAGTVYSSLLAADGKLYAVTRRNGTIVMAAKPDFTEIARNKFASDESDFNASPAVSGGRLFLRSDRFLYAVGKPKA